MLQHILPKLIRNNIITFLFKKTCAKIGWTFLKNFILVLMKLKTYKK